VSERAFVDTNIWVYAVDTADAAKQARALDVLAPGLDKDYVISVQVIGEFYSTVTGKLKHAVTATEARVMVERMKQLPVMPLDIALVNDAIEGCGLWDLSYWDSLILAAARSAGCSVVISEDLSHGASYGSVRVENPFLDVSFAER
jgi:predicted nucleic acid-binding protein